jgi:hypothetical protein
MAILVATTRWRSCYRRKLDRVTYAIHSHRLLPQEATNQAVNQVCPAIAAAISLSRNVNWICAYTWTARLAKPWGSNGVGESMLTEAVRRLAAPPPRNRDPDDLTVHIDDFSGDIDEQA